MLFKYYQNQPKGMESIHLPQQSELAQEYSLFDHFKKGVWQVTQKEKRKKEKRSSY